MIRTRKKKEKSSTAGKKDYAPDRGAHLSVGHHYRNEEYHFGNWDVVDLCGIPISPAIAARESTGMMLLYSHVDLPYFLGSLGVPVDFSHTAYAWKSVD